MKIIFLDQLGCHASVIAASYAAGFIGELPNSHDISRLPFFAVHNDLKKGKVYCISAFQDKEIYSLGAGKYAGLIKTAADDLARIFGKKGEACFIDVSGYNSFPVRVIMVITSLLPAGRTIRRITAVVSRWGVKRLLEKVKSELAGINWNGA